MQNDRFQFQTVANTGQMVLGKKTKKNPKPEGKKIQKLFYTFIISFGVGFHVVPQFDHSTGRSHWLMVRFDPDQL